MGEFADRGGVIDRAFEDSTRALEHDKIWRSAIESMHDWDINGKDHPNYKELKEQYKKTVKELNETRLESWRQARESHVQLNDGIAKHLDIPIDEVDLNDPKNAKLKEYLVKEIQDSVNTLKEAAKRLGEKYDAATNINELSSSFLSSLKEKLKSLKGFEDANPKITMFTIFMWISIITAIGGILDKGIWPDKKDWDDITNKTTGCYQYNQNKESGVFFTQWSDILPATNKTGTCCQACPLNGDQNKHCTLTNNKTCTDADDCVAGDDARCVNGKCYLQSCDTENIPNTCTPCPSPAMPLIDQVKYMTFCQVDGSSCGTSYQLCLNPDEGGANRHAKKDDKDNSYYTEAVCMTTDSFILSIMYLNKYKNDWMPEKTPITIYIMAALTILGLIVTFGWYIWYLIKHAKKK